MILLDKWNPSNRTFYICGEIMRRREYVTKEKILSMRWIYEKNIRKCKFIKR